MAAESDIGGEKVQVGCQDQLVISCLDGQSGGADASEKEVYISSKGKHYRLMRIQIIEAKGGFTVEIESSVSLCVCLLVTQALAS